MAVIYFFALRGCPCPYAAAYRPGLEITVAFSFVYLFNKAFYAHLAFQFLPEKNQCGMWVGIYLVPFGAVIIRKENKPLGTQPFQQYDTGMWHGLRISSSQGHRIDFGYLRCFSFSKPFAEKGKRVKANSFLIKRREPVILPDISNMER